MLSVIQRACTDVIQLTRVSQEMSRAIRSLHVLLFHYVRDADWLTGRTCDSLNDKLAHFIESSLKELKTGGSSICWLTLKAIQVLCGWQGFMCLASSSAAFPDTLAGSRMRSRAVGAQISTHVRRGYP